MKKILACMMAAMMVLGLAACGSPSSSSAPAAGTEAAGTEAAGTEAAGEMASGKLAEVQAAGKLVVATSPDFPPFEYLDGTDVVGIEVEIMQMICEELGVELELAQMDFDSVIAGVPAGKFDIGMSGISVTEDRKENALFTDPYCMAAQAIVVVEGSEIASKADLEGKKVSVQTATTAEEFTMSAGYDVSAFAANNDAEMALVTGKVDAWVIDDLTAAEMVAAYNEQSDTKLVILDEAMTSEPYAFSTALGNDDLIAAINEVLVKLVDDGTVASIFEKYNAPYTSPAEN